MTEQDYLWLLARAYIAIRNNYITSHIAPVYDALATALTEASGLPFHNVTDSDVVDYFRPREPIVAAPSVEKPKSKRTKEE